MDKEGYTHERYLREQRIVDLHDQMKELAGTELQGTYSSDGLLWAATMIWQTEQLLKQALVSGSAVLPSQGLPEAERIYGRGGIEPCNERMEVLP